MDLNFLFKSKINIKTGKVISQGGDVGGFLIIFSRSKAAFQDLEVSITSVPKISILLLAICFFFGQK